jgi:hypothetical protein
VKSALAVTLALAALSFSKPAPAGEDHKIELDATVGVRFGGALEVTLDSDDGDIPGRITADSSIAFGGIVSYRFQSNGFVFLNFSRQETDVHFRPNNIDEQAVETNGAIDYLQFGGNLEITRGALTPYFGFSIGAAHFASHEDGGDSWRFAGAFDGGVKLRILPFLHLRLLGRLPITFVDGELYCYTGYGCAAVSHGVPFVQGEVQVGVGLDF